MYASEQKNMRFSGIFFSKSIPNGSSGKTTPPCLWNDHNWLVNLPFSDTPKIILKLVSWTSCIILSIYISIYLSTYIYIYIMNLVRIYPMRISPLISIFFPTIHWTMKSSWRDIGSTSFHRAANVPPAEGCWNETVPRRRDRGQWSSWWTWEVDKKNSWPLEKTWGSSPFFGVTLW